MLYLHSVAHGRKGMMATVRGGNALGAPGKQDGPDDQAAHGGEDGRAAHVERAVLEEDLAGRHGEREAASRPPTLTQEEHQVHASPRAWQMTSPSRFSAAAVTARVASGWLRALSEGCESDNRVCLTTTAAQRCQAVLHARPTSSKGADHRRAPVQERQVGSPPVAAGRGAAAVAAAASRPAPAPTAAATAGASGRRAAAASAAAVFQARRGGVRGAALQWRRESKVSPLGGVGRETSDSAPVATAAAAACWRPPRGAGRRRVRC